MISLKPGEVRIKRHALLLILLFVTSFGLFLGLQRRPGSVGPKPVALGKTMTQLLPDETEKPQAWKITKWEVPRDKLPDLVLPDDLRFPRSGRSRWDVVVDDLAQKRGTVSVLLAHEIPRVAVILISRGLDDRGCAGRRVPGDV